MMILTLNDVFPARMVTWVSTRCISYKDGVFTVRDVFSIMIALQNLRAVDPTRYIPCTKYSTWRIPYKDGGTRYPIRVMVT
jgi:hypothetical protein